MMVKFLVSKKLQLIFNSILNDDQTLTGQLQIYNIDSYMGNCATHKALQKDKQSRSTEDTNTSHKILYQEAFQQKEINSMKLIYQDLAERSKAKSLNLRNFGTFFQLNLALGARLLDRFQKQNGNRITEKQFIKNILLIMDLNQEKRIKFIFQILDVRQNNSLSYIQLLGIFLAYPRQCMNQILGDERFFNFITHSQLCKIILNPRKEIQISLENMSLYPSLKYRDFVQKVENQNKPSCKTYDLSLISEGDLAIQSKENLIKVLKCKMSRQLYNIQIITLYAQYFFKNLNLDIEKDAMKFSHFKKIVIENKILFNNLFINFHQYLWKTQNGFPLYKTIVPWISDYCTYIKEKVISKVYIAFIKTSILVFESHQMKQPLAIKNLQGLNIKPVDGDQGYGFIIFHNQSYYPPTEFFFQDRAKQEEWLSATKQFRLKNIEQRYKIKQKIASGKYSQVYSCHQKSTNEKYAVKIIKKKSNQLSSKWYNQESQIISMCAHQNIVKIYERFETNKCIYLVMELLPNENLQQFISNNRKRSEQQTKILMRQLIQALHQIHSLGFVHGNIKLENILVKSQNGGIVPIIIGFGKATRGLKSKNEKQIKEKGKINTNQSYKNQNIEEKDDIYNIGIVMYYLLTGSYPNINDKNEYIFDLDTYQWQRISHKAKDLIKKLTCDRNSRLSSAQILKHKWFLK